MRYFTWTKELKHLLVFRVIVKKGLQLWTWTRHIGANIKNCPN